MISGLAPFARPNVTPQPNARGQSDGARLRESFQGAAENNTAGRAGAAAPQGQATQTARPIPPVNGLLALDLEQIEALQGSNSPRAPEKAEKSETASEEKSAPGALSEEDETVVKELAARDREVRQHERAHAAAGGAHAGAPSYQYQQGPDGKRYAVGGEVSIDVSPVQGNPDATIAKMRQVKAAAMAPAQPSGQDRAVAASADAMIQQAQVERSQKPDETSAPQDVDPAAPDAPANAAKPGETTQTGQGPDATAETGRAPVSPTSFPPDPATGRPPRDIPPGSFADISI